MMGRESVRGRGREREQEEEEVGGELETWLRSRSADVVFEGGRFGKGTGPGRRAGVGGMDLTNDKRLSTGWVCVCVCDGWSKPMNGRATGWSVYVGWESVRVKRRSHEATEWVLGTDGDG